MPNNDDSRYGELARFLAQPSTPDRITLRELADLMDPKKFGAPQAGLTPPTTPGIRQPTNTLAGLSRSGIPTATQATLKSIADLLYPEPGLPKAPTNTLAGLLQSGTPTTSQTYRGIADLLYPEQGVPRFPLQQELQSYGLPTAPLPPEISRGILGLDSFNESDLDRRIARQAAPFQVHGLLAARHPMLVQIFDVEHGSCAVVGSPDRQRIAMLDCGHNTTSGWRPSRFIRQGLGRQSIDYFFNLNFDQDHISDLVGVSNALNVDVLHRNPTPTSQALRRIKEENGRLTDDAEQYLSMLGAFTAPVTMPFDQGMGGVTYRAFWNSYPRFKDTNNLSLVVFVKYGNFKMLFPGDMEREGWLALLEDPDFRAELAGTTILVAAHHGRYNGYCEEIFSHFEPMAIIISDKEIAHETQLMTDVYGYHVSEAGVLIGTNGKRRRVLTTRKDGDILLRVGADDRFSIGTESEPI